MSRAVGYREMTVGTKQAAKDRGGGDDVTLNSRKFLFFPKSCCVSLTPFITSSELLFGFYSLLFFFVVCFWFVVVVLF